MTDGASDGYAIGIDIGATRIKAVAVRPGGEVVEAASETTSDNCEKWKSAVPGLVSAFEASHGSARWIGVSAPGLARRDHRAIGWMRGRLDGIEEYDWTKAAQAVARSTRSQ